MGFTDCYGYRGYPGLAYSYQAILTSTQQVLELYRKPRAEPPGLDFTQHSPVRCAESLPILHSKLLGSCEPCEPHQAALIKDLCNPGPTLWLWKIYSR